MKHFHLITFSKNHVRSVRLPEAPLRRRPQSAGVTRKVSRREARGRERASTRRDARDRSARRAAVRRAVRGGGARTCRRPGRTNEGNGRGSSGRRRRAPCVGSAPDVVGALVVRDQYRTARDIRVVRMRQRDGARAQAGEQQERDTGTPDPRLTAEHRIQLSERAGCVKHCRLADW